MSHADNSKDEEEDAHNAQQYTWLAYSPKILMNLAPAVRSMFPAILCGKRAVNRAVVTLISDRLNAVHEQGAETAAAGPRVVRGATRPVPGSPVRGPHGWIHVISERHPVLCKSSWHLHPSHCPVSPSVGLYSEACSPYHGEKMPMYRHQILSVTGEILCIDGTRKVLKKIYGDGQGTMQYVTSVLNECGQFLMTVWNNRMSSLQVAGGQGRQTCIDARQIQRINQQAEVLFGKDHVHVPVPDAYEHPDEEELLGVEYAMCQSTSFTARDYYVQKGVLLKALPTGCTAEPTSDTPA
ncbi:unnamed protein product [Merluccius merluccius]